MIDYGVSLPRPSPEAEQLQQRRFVEHFSLISGDTFQSVPMLSCAAAASPAPGPRASHDIEEHCKFMDQVLGSLAQPFARIRVPAQRPLGIAIA
jgi:hypothetical protein